MANLPQATDGATKARDRAGKLLGISGKTVDQAAYVRTHGIPELEVAVRGVAFSVYRATQIAEEPADRGRKVYQDSR